MFVESSVFLRSLGPLLAGRLKADRWAEIHGVGRDGVRVDGGRRVWLFQASGEWADIDIVLMQRVPLVSSRRPQCAASGVRTSISRKPEPCAVWTTIGVGGSGDALSEAALSVTTCEAVAWKWVDSVSAPAHRTAGSSGDAGRAATAERRAGMVQRERRTVAFRLRRKEGRRGGKRSGVEGSGGE